MKWEYDYRALSDEEIRRLSREEFLTFLNGLGALGWEICAWLADPRCIQIVFKRPIPEINFPPDSPLFSRPSVSDVT